MNLTPLKRIRLLLLLFIIGLIVSGATAIPLETELRWGVELARRYSGFLPAGLVDWLVTVRDGLVQTNSRFPFLAYGTDWLAFAHFVISIAFVGPWRDPVKNVWVIQFGMIACFLVVPFALLMGEIRGIPLGWRLIDCSFGILGAITLLACRKQVRILEKSLSG